MVRYSSLIRTMTVSSISVRARSPHPTLLFHLLFYLFIFFCGEYLSCPFYDMAASTSGKEEANPVF